MAGYITGEQLRAARAMLGWDQAELAEKARVSVKTIKRLEAMSGKLDARSDWAVAKALELGGVEFIDGDDYRRRGEGVRFQADRTAAMREKICESVGFHLPGALKRLTDEDQDLFDRNADDIINIIMKGLEDDIRFELRSSLNKKS